MIHYVQISFSLNAHTLCSMKALDKPHSLVTTYPFFLVISRISLNR